MKKILSMILVIMIFVSCFAFSVIPSSAYEYLYDDTTKEAFTSEDGYLYRIINDGTAIICGIPEGTIEAVIPEEVDGYKVTRLGAHNQRFKGGEIAKSLTVPDTVSKIDLFVLYSFPVAEEINLPSTITDLGDPNYFKRTEYYKNPDNWDNGVLYIGTNIVAINKDVGDTLVLREDTTCVAERVFADTGITIKELVYPRHYIYGLSNLTGAALEKGIVYKEMGVVADSLFSGCSSLTDVIIEDGVTDIGKYGFSGCSSLTSVKIPETVTHIGESAFVNCENIKKIYVPSSVTSIDEYAFGYERYTYYDYFSRDYLTAYRLYNDFVLEGEMGTAAEEYAQANNIPFVTSLDEVATFDECFGKSGDTDLSGKVNVKDATLIQKYLADLEKMSDNSKALGDVDGNDSVNIKDATAIQKFIAGIETGLDIEKTTDVRLYYMVYAKKGLKWHRDGSFNFQYYQYEEGDMVDYPGISAEFDYLKGGYVALIPAEATYVSVNFSHYMTEYVPMPEKDGMMLVPNECLYDYVYDVIWK